MQDARRTGCVGVAVYWNGHMRAFAARIHRADRVPSCRHADGVRVGAPFDRRLVQA